MYIVLFENLSDIKRGFAASAPVRSAVRDCCADWGFPGADVEVDATGRPLCTAHGIGLSVSHSGRFGLLCVARGAVGVDIELERDLDHLRIARRFFPEADADFVETRGAPGFFTLWTLREALYKRGPACGLSSAQALRLPLVRDGEPVGSACGALLWTMRARGLCISTAADERPSGIDRVVGISL